MTLEYKKSSAMHPASTKLYSGAGLGLLGVRIQHAVYVYQILQLNSCCEIASQSAWGRRNGTREKEHPPLPLLLLHLLRPRSSILVDPKDPDSVELRQFGDQDAHEGDGVDDEVDPVILCVKAG